MAKKKPPSQGSGKRTCQCKKEGCICNTVVAHPAHTKCRDCAVLNKHTYAEPQHKKS
jgi:hypothetical protein